ncbi:unknown protein [Seminavis robusta]|uniref:Uncharacterized protein n=1 Tax=Seminavis robusta TaxID=568900 RepID=A0A9N8HV00_9STRA|nr:unknown protein [Seminavis robusta]|eukprot:Sro2206_g319010.1 n/a (347) ;mRNA; r:8869-9909
MFRLLVLLVLSVSLFVSCNGHPSATNRIVLGNAAQGDCYDIDIIDSSYWPDDYGPCTDHGITFIYRTAGSDQVALEYAGEGGYDFVGDESMFLVSFKVYVFTGCEEDSSDADCEIYVIKDHDTNKTGSCNSCRMEGATAILEECGDIEDLFASSGLPLQVEIGSDDYDTQFIPLANSRCEGFSASQATTIADPTPAPSGGLRGGKEHTSLTFKVFMTFLFVPNDGQTPDAEEAEELFGVVRAFFKARYQESPSFQQCGFQDLLVSNLVHESISASGDFEISYDAMIVIGKGCAANKRDAMNVVANKQHLNRFMNELASASQQGELQSKVFSLAQSVKVRVVGHGAS